MNKKHKLKVESASSVDFSFQSYDPFQKPLAKGHFSCAFIYKIL